MSVSASAVSSLRARTGVSILACKQALDEAGGDEEKAIEILKKRGLAQAAKKAARDQSEGSIFLLEKNGKAALVLLKCETDFVARDENFQSLGKELVESLLAHGTSAMEKISVDRIPEIVQKLGENISVGETHLIEAPVLGTYLHSNAKIGVVIGLEKGSTEIARDIAMHACAMNPLYTTPDEVPASAVEKEKEIWKEQLAKEGKPPQIMEKIMIGKEKKFREENALVKQPFVKDTTKTVEQHLGGAKVTAYVRVAVG